MLLKPVGATLSLLGRNKNLARNQPSYKDCEPTPCSPHGGFLYKENPLLGRGFSIGYTDKQGCLWIHTINNLIPRTTTLRGDEKRKKWGSFQT